MDDIIKVGEDTVQWLLATAGSDSITDGQDALNYASAAQVVMQVLTFAYHNQADEAQETEKPKEYVN